jgi:hypothetical protein
MLSATVALQLDRPAPIKSEDVATDNTIEAVRNRKNQKLFIVVDDTIDARYKVINPAGETLILPDL